MISIEEALTRLVEHREIFHDEMVDLVRAMIEGRLTPAQIAALTMGLRVKKETVGEIAAAASVLRDCATRVPVGRVDALVDLVGTGGDGADTFNISTCSAFVAAAAGVPVAKHCGRGVSSKSGSADVLRHLDVSLDLTPEAVGRSIDELGIGFMFAPNYHQALKSVMSIRADMKIRTIFNILGPMINPARTIRQVTGVFHPDLVGILSRVLQRLGTVRAMVVYGLDSLDEISVSAPTMVAEVRDEWVREYELHPEMVGLSLSERSALSVDGPEESAERILKVLKGGTGPERDIVLFNAAATLFIGDTVETLEEGVDLSRRAIDSGEAYRKLEVVRAFCQANSKEAVHG